MNAHIMINISNRPKAIDFYDKLMELVDFKLVFSESDEKGGAKLYIKDGFNFWIKYENKEITTPFNREIGIDHIGFEVENKELVDKIYLVLREEGIKITREPRDYPHYSSNYYAFYFRDHDGIPLEVMSN